MPPRIRPATTLCLVLGVAFAFQLLAVLSVPVTNSIYLSHYQGYKFGVFGLCYNKTCSEIRIGYSANSIDDLKGFSLPSNARHSISKLLIVHPISAGFTLLLLIGSFLLHWHGPSSSLRLLFFLLLWTIPTFLLSLLSFLVDILLFIPHLAWGGWIMLASTVLIAISGVLFCIMRRTKSSRKSAKKMGRSNTFNEYQMAPLSYGIGTVDGGSVSKVTSEDDEAKPFVHDGNNTYNLDNSFQHTENDDLNNFPQTEIYNTMRNENNNSQQSRYAEDVLAPLQSSYRGYSEYNTFDNTNAYRSPKINTPDQFINPIPPFGEDAIQPSAAEISTPLIQRSQDQSSIPYPTGIPQAALVDLPGQQTVAPYPTSEFASSSSNLLPPSSPSKPLGPRPMPNSATDLTALDTNAPYPRSSYQDEEPEFGFESPSNADFTAPFVISEPEVERKPTYRTAIEQKLNELQSMPISDSLVSLNSANSFASDQVVKHQRQIGPLNESDIETSYEDTTNIDTTMEDITNIVSVNSQANSATLPSTAYFTSASTTNNAAIVNPGVPVIDDDEDDEDDLYTVSATRQANQQPDEISYNDIYKQSKPGIEDELLPSGDNLAQIDATSSTYSSRIPSRVPSVAATPVNDQFPREVHRQVGTIPEDATIQDTTPSDYSAQEYPFPDPMEKRTTPAPSFSNESILSSTFTSVSQRGINPKYLEKHDPAQYNLYLQRQIQNQLQPDGISGGARDSTSLRQTTASPQQQKGAIKASIQRPTASDLLIASNPDFTIAAKNRRKK